MGVATIPGMHYCNFSYGQGLLESKQHHLILNKRALLNGWLARQLMSSGDIDDAFAGWSDPDHRTAWSLDGSLEQQVCLSVLHMTIYYVHSFDDDTRT